MAFVPQPLVRIRLPLYSAPIQEDETKETTSEEPKSSEGLPWWWEFVWNNFDVLKPGKDGDEITFGDSANVLRTNIEQLYGDYDSIDGCPVAEGALNDLAEGTMFVGLQNYYENYGSPYKLCFGPKSFLVVSDPMQAKHILRDANTNYDKGVLAEILEVRTVGTTILCVSPSKYSRLWAKD